MGAPTWPPDPEQAFRLTAREYGVRPEDIVLSADGPGLKVDITVTDDGVVYVTDIYDASPGVWAFSSKFEPLYRLAHPDMRVPTYICTSPEGFVFISELASNRVFIYGPRDLVLEHQRQQRQAQRLGESSDGQQ